MSILPSDVIMLEMGNRKHCVRVTHSELLQNGLVKISGVSEDLDIYERNIAYLDIESEQGTTQIETKFEILDIPQLSFELHGDSEARILIAAYGMQKKWQGCCIYYTNSENNNFQKMIDVHEAATMGATVGSLGAASNYLIDNKNIIIVNLINGTLKSITEQDFLNNKNLALIGDEIIQFKTAELISENIYRLKYLQRGKCGTEAEIYNHKVGDRFILLDNKIRSFTLQHFAIGQSFKMKAITFGSPSDENKNLSEVLYRANNLRPLHPVSVKWQIIDNQIKITWIRRTRKNGEWRDYVDVPLHEAEKLYSIVLKYKGEIIANYTSNVEYRTVSISDLAISDLHNLNIEDLNVDIRQISAVVGV